MAIIVQDVRYAIRLLLKRPGFAAVAIMDAGARHRRHYGHFHRRQRRAAEPLPFSDAERLVEVRIISKNGEDFLLPDADFLAWRSQNQTCDAIAVYDASPATLVGDGVPERIAAAAVTDRFFDVLGARPLLGRVFQVGDDKPGAPPALSDSCC